ncbi:hypothetical protein D3C78_981640 [compost metagenome]
MQGALRALVAVLQVQFDDGMLVASLAVGLRPAVGTGLPRVGTLAEQLVEEVAEGFAVAAVVRMESMAFVPVRRRLEAVVPAEPARRRSAELVVGGALFGIGQHRIGFVELGHALGGILVLAQIRVVFPGQAPVRLLDVLGARVFGDAQDLVVVLVVHAVTLRCGRMATMEGLGASIGRESLRATAWPTAGVPGAPTAAVQC